MSPRERLAAAATSLPARLLVTFALLALVATMIDWGTLADALSGASWGWFAAAIGLILASFVLGALRWRLLLRAAALPVGVGLALRAYVCGAFANNLLPTGFGGDAVRAWLVARSRGSLARSLTSVLVDRATSLACGLVLAWIAIAVDRSQIPDSYLVALALCSAAALASFAVAGLVLRRGRLGRFLPRRMGASASDVAATLRGYLRDRRLFAEVVVLGVGFQAITVGAIWTIGRMLGLGVDLAVFAVVTPLVLIATALPISIAGFGVREGSFVALLGAVGVNASEATLLSLLSVAALALASLPGGATLLLGPGRPAIAAMREPPDATTPNATLARRPGLRR